MRLAISRFKIGKVLRSQGLNIEAEKVLVESLLFWRGAVDAIPIADQVAQRLPMNGVLPLKRGSGRSSSNINGLREILVLKWVVKRHALGTRCDKNLPEPRGERCIGEFIGPEAEDAAGTEMRGKPPQS